MSRNTDFLIPTRIWFTCSVLAAIISGIIFGAKVGGLLHSVSAPLINATHPQVSSALSFSVPTSTDVSVPGTTQIQVNPAGLFLRSITATINYDPKSLTVQAVEVIPGVCPDAEKPTQDEKTGSITIVCDNPALKQGEMYNSLATIKYTPLVAGSSLLKFDGGGTHGFGSGESTKNLIHGTENTILTVK